MKVAIVGSGISGLACAWKLRGEHEAVVFEDAATPGGHVSTVDVELNGQLFPVDTGFIVYNARNYPGFSALLQQLGAETRPTEMSFSVSCAQTGLEYGGQNLNSLFAQRVNAVNPRFVRMVSEIVRFNRQSLTDLVQIPWSMTIGDYLNQSNFQGLFRSHYLMPMAASIWSCPADSVAHMPARLFIEFFRNHGLLSLSDRPQWRTLVGGSKRYVELLRSRLPNEIRVNCPVRQITRRADAVLVHTAHGSERFDQVVFACHSDQALQILATPSPEETEVLTALPFQRNEVVLHTDTSLLPNSRRAWAAWNYYVDGGAPSRTQVTYNMNMLQGLDCQKTFCVTLNDAERISEERILGRYLYDHPIYNLSSQMARQRRWEISGHNRSWYCGAYWGYGFHEDGFQSALDVANRLTSAKLEAA